MNKYVYGVSLTDSDDLTLIRMKIFSTLENAIDFANAFSTDCDGEFAMRFKDDEEYNEDNWTEDKRIVEELVDEDSYYAEYIIGIEKFTLDVFEF